jgi:hypothetical protein
MSDSKFQVGDKIRIKKESEIPEEHEQDYQRVQIILRSNFQNRPGTVTQVNSPFDDGMTTYSVKTSISHSRLHPKSTKPNHFEPFMVHFVPEYALDHEIIMTPETDAVFRDIIRDV